MSNAFATDTAANALNANADTDALEAYVSNHQFDTFEQFEEAFEIAGATKRAGDGSLERVTKLAINGVLAGKIIIEKPVPGAKKAGSEPSAVDKLVAKFTASDATAVRDGTGSSRNIKVQLNAILGYAKSGIGTNRQPRDTIDSALVKAEIARGTDRKGKGKVPSNMLIMEAIAKRARHEDYKNFTDPLPSSEIDKIVDPAAPVKAEFNARVLKQTKAWNDDKDAPQANELWNNVMNALNAYNESVQEAKEADAAQQSFAANASAMLKAGTARVNKNGTVTLKLTAEQLAKLQEMENA